MAERGISSGEFYCPPQYKPMAESIRTHTVNVLKHVYPYVTRLDHVVTYTKEECGYPGDRSDRVHIEGGRDVDR